MKTNLELDQAVDGTNEWHTERIGDADYVRLDEAEATLRELTEEMLGLRNSLFEQTRVLSELLERLFDAATQTQPGLDDVEITDEEIRQAMQGHLLN